MADNRDPRKKSRTRRQLRTSSSGRAARSKASAKDTPRPTSSTDRAKQQGKGSRKVTTGKGGTKPTLPQGPRQPPVQGPYQKPPKGMIGSRNVGPKKSTTKAPPTSRPKIPQGVKGAANAVQKTRGLITAGAGLLRGDLTMVAGTIASAVASKIKDNKRETPHNAGGPKKGSKGPGMSKKAVEAAKSGAKAANKAKPKKTTPKKTSSKAAQFDSAFASARKAGKSEFTWNGKKYNTKVK